VKTEEIIKKAKKLQKLAMHRRKDPRYRRVIGFFKAKGLLIAENIPARPIAKLDLNDVLWVAEKLEPRVFEILPAAILHFPKTFLNLKILPYELQLRVDAIKNHKNINEDFRGIEFKKMKRWANLQLQDYRIIPINERKIAKNYRFRPTVITALKKRAKKIGISETECLEQLILAD
jgi:hypothetical protein